MDWTMFDLQIDVLSDEYRKVAYDLRIRTDRYVGPYNLYNLADEAGVLTSRGSLGNVY